MSCNSNSTLSLTWCGLGNKHLVRPTLFSKQCMLAFSSQGSSFSSFLFITFTPHKMQSFKISLSKSSCDIILTNSSYSSLLSSSAVSEPEHAVRHMNFTWVKYQVLFICNFFMYSGFTDLRWSSSNGLWS